MNDLSINIIHGRFDSRIDYKSALSGIIPPLTSPFDKRGDLVITAIAEQVERIIDAGCSGVVIGGSTGEGHTLSQDELVASTQAACEASRGRVPVLGGLIVNSTRSAVQAAKRLAQLPVAALQVTPIHYLFKPSDDATVQHFRTIAEESGLPIIIYNVIAWNYLSVELMLRIMDEVPSVIGMKQSNGDLKSLSDLVERADPKNLVTSGIDSMLYPAFVLGSNGAITALTAAVPDICVQLWNATHAGRHEEALKLHRLLAAVWARVNHGNLPAITKYIQHKRGQQMFYPRAPMDFVSSDQMADLEAPLHALEVGSKRLRDAH